jgi:monovalent cation:proton antiporter-2 (CPA2) family protein
MGLFPESGAMVSAYLLDLLFLLIAAVLIVPLFQLARLGTVPGFLVAGVVVGPSGLSIIDNVTEIRHLSEIGVVLLLFVIGMELKPSRLWVMRRLVFGLGTAQVFATGFVLGLLGVVLFDLPTRTAVFVGPALALSSTAFVLQILAEQKQLTTRYGRAAISVLLLQDLAVVPLLALIPLLASPRTGFSGDIGLALLESLFILMLVVVLGRFLLHPLLHRVARAGSPEVFTASAVLIVLGTAMATEHAGLSMAMGAFLAGLLISESAYRHQVIAEIQPFRGLLLGLFFMSMGMSFELERLLSDPFGALALLGLLLLVKTAILFPLALLFGLGSRVSMAVALLLAQCGEFALVLFALALQSGLIPGPRFQSLLVVVLLSMMVTPALAHAARRLVGSTRSAAQGPQRDPVVLVGFGSIGQHAGEILTGAGLAFVAVDPDPERVATERARGHPVHYLDPLGHGLLDTLNARDTPAVLVTLDDPEASGKLLRSLQEQYPDTELVALGPDLPGCRSLASSGASSVIPADVTASLELTRMVLEKAGLRGDAASKLISKYRRQCEALLEHGQPVDRTRRRRFRDHT